MLTKRLVSFVAGNTRRTLTRGSTLTLSRKRAGEGQNFRAVEGLKRSADRVFDESRGLARNVLNFGWTKS